MAHLRRREFVGLLGGAAVWPLAAHAQQPTMPVVGWLSIRSPDDSKFAIDAFGRGLKEAGYAVGRNVAIEYRWANSDPDRLPELVADLVRRPVDVIAVLGSTVGALAAKVATTEIPIVFVNGADPVKLGLVASLNRPGGNLTGVTFITTELGAKRLELLHEMVPKADVIAVLLNPDRPGIEIQEGDARMAARAIGKQVQIFFADSGSKLDSAFATFDQQGVRALLVGTDPFFTSQRFRLAALAARHRIPAIYTLREYAEAGGLMSYGASLTDAFRQTGAYVGRILSGTKPFDLPIVRPTKLELVINLKTARALGLEIPPTLLARADEVIE
jgi:putative tryptophan/tyrosine transport system substrate-binding protein